MPYRATFLKLPHLQVKRAADRAREEYRRENPEAELEDLQVALPPPVVVPQQQLAYPHPGMGMAVHPGWQPPAIWGGHAVQAQFLNFDFGPGLQHGLFGAEQEAPPPPPDPYGRAAPRRRLPPVANPRPGWR